MKNSNISDGRRRMARLTLRRGEVPAGVEEIYNLLHAARDLAEKNQLHLASYFITMALVESLESLDKKAA
ncbi:MAG: hypothetical protein VX871_09730 [Pseudomonadota bacterium]|nr:hypothetical protein [Pseudomonadota bacterium]